MEKICQLKDVFICDPNHRCTAVQPFCLSVMYGKAILVRWEKITENVPKEKIYTIPVKGGRGHSHFAEKGKLRSLPLLSWKDLCLLRYEELGDGGGHLW